jgi:hypothetical protein
MVPVVSGMPVPVIGIGGECVENVMRQQINHQIGSYLIKGFLDHGTETNSTALYVITV